jgi:hypothetical protein
MVFTAKSPSIPRFQSYIAAPDGNGVTDGRTVLPGSEKKAAKGSSYDPAAGTIVIDVPISQLGLKPGDTITGFNSAVVLNSTGAVGDAMPADYNAAQFSAPWPYTIYANAHCPG